MKTIIFNNYITQEPVTDLINQIESSLPTDLVNIYFSVKGGDASYKNVLINYINQTMGVVNYNIIAFDSLYGPGFECFLKFTPFKSILPETVGVFYKYEIPEVITKESKLYASEIKKCNKDLFEWYKLMNPKQNQLKEFNAGKTVYYDYTELQTILANYKDVLAPIV